MSFASPRGTWSTRWTSLPRSVRPVVRLLTAFAFRSFLTAAACLLWSLCAVLRRRDRAAHGRDEPLYVAARVRQVRCAAAAGSPVGLACSWVTALPTLSVRCAVRCGARNASRTRGTLRTLSSCAESNGPCCVRIARNTQPGSHANVWRRYEPDLQQQAQTTGFHPIIWSLATLAARPTTAA